MKDGWYYVEVINPSPADDEVKSFPEWVEMSNGKWDMRELEKFTVGEVYKSEINNQIDDLINRKIND